ncbi:MAG: aminotransferase class IV [Pseudomonadota bacterium]|nr:aminotransferase class IV [Pseudomonadota bacterium]MEC7960799.1 aminotransferase class IV [Pseudomonadota bacterium]
MQRKIWINGNYINWEDAQVHILSHSHQRGSLIFGFIPIFDNEGVVSIFRLNDHIDRLFTSCISAGIPLDYSFEEIYFAIKDTVRKNPGSKFVKISVYISSIEVDVVPQDPFSTVAIAAYDPQEDIISKNTQPFHSSKELSVWLEKEKHQRRSDIIPPQIKIAGNYTSSMMAKWQARKNGYDEIILTDENGFITEAPTSNVFLVNNDGDLLTAPEKDVLYGITRKSILDIAKNEGIKIKVERIPLLELENAKEVFITSSSHLVCPVIKIDNKFVGNGVIGDLTARLKKRFLDITQSKDEIFNYWLEKI